MNATISKNRYWMPRTLRMSILYICFGLLGISASTAHAGIASLSGDVEILAPPFSVQEGAIESDSAARLILEREFFVLPIDLNVDISTSGVFNEAIDLTPGSIAAGTRVNSYLLHADAVGNGGTSYDGTIVFAEQILGVIVTRDNFQPSHPIVGSPSTTYPADGSNDANRAPLNFVNFGEEITVILPNNTLNFSLRRVGGSLETYDHVRIITAAVPEPSTLTMLAIGTLTLGMVRRRRSR